MEKKSLFESDGFRAVLASLISIIFGMAVGSIIILIVGLKDPSLGSKSVWDGIRLVFGGLFSTGRDASGALTWGFNSSNMGNMLFRATPLIMTGLSVAMAYKTGLFNIGAPGQYLMGTMVSLIVALSIPSWVVPPQIIWFLAFFAGMLAGALWGMIAGAFKAYIHSSEIIVSLLLNYIAAQIISYLLRGPMMAQGVTVPESELVPEAAHMPTLMANTSANAGIFFAFGLLVIYGVFMYKTRTGYKIRTLGYSEKAAKYGGVEKSKYDVLLMAVSGGIVGLAGGMEVLGGQYRLVEGIANNMGFTGVVVALVGLLQPVGIALAAVFMAVLTVGSKYMQIMSKVPVALKDVLEALMVLFILWGFSLNLKRRRIKEGN